jgi:lantibiotic biosynthesis protein
MESVSFREAQATQTWTAGVGSSADRARAVALEIVKRLRDPQRNKPGDISLACGEAGFAVLYGYLDRCFPNCGWDRVAHEAVLRIGDQISPYQPLGLFGGLAGWAYATWYLSCGDKRYRRARSAIEDALLPKVIALADSVGKRSGLPVEEYDLVSGLSGATAYLLCRAGDERVQPVLESAVAGLANLILRNEDPPAWYTPADVISGRHMIGKYPDGNLNCGVAHGMPGLLCVLALAYRQEVPAPGLRTAIERAAHWLEAHRISDRWGGSWPAAVAVGNSGLMTPAPVGWCYGNPGIARALWLAGIALNNSALRETAVEALRAVFRRSVARRGISSPTFCHGVAGLLHITKRFATDTSLPEFTEAAAMTIDELLMTFSEETVFGYRAYDAEARLVDSAGLLDGAAGIALVLLAATSNVEPGWDRVFLLS